MTFFPFANSWELGTAALAFAVVLFGHRLAPFLPRALIDWPVETRWHRAAFAILIATVLTISVGEVSQFQTADETYYINKSLFLPAVRGTDVWIQGGLHTGQLIFVSFARLLEIAAVDVETIKTLIKCLHWLVGCIVIVAIVKQMGALIRIRPHLEPAFFTFSYLVILTLPISNVALKTLNYDAISLLGSVLAILLATRMMVEQRRDLAVPAIVCAALAAQEKLSAGPFLLLVCALVGAANGGDQTRRPFLRAAAIAALALCGAALVCLATNLAMALLVADEPAAKIVWPALWTFIDPLVSWLAVPLRFLFNLGEVYATVKDRLRLNLALLPLVLVATGAAAGFVAVLLRHRTRLAPLVRAVPAAAAAALLGLPLLGTAGLALVTPYWAPMAPVQEGGVAIGALNGARLHFQATSWSEHFLSAVMFAYGVIIATTPTTILLLTLLGAAGVLVWRRSASRLVPVAILLLCAVVLPAAQALMGAPTFSRYMNLPILLWVATAFLLAVPLLGVVWRRGSGWQLASAALLCVLLVAEIAPFRPLYAAFRPIMLSYPEADRALPGHLNFSWTGWGEETLLAGKELARRCRKAPGGRIDGIACADITIEAYYPSEWLPGRNETIQSISGRIRGPDEWPAGPENYYVVNRQAVVGGLLSALPEQTPEFAVRYRGFAIAWVYRGDRLKASGYRFSPP